MMNFGGAIVSGFRNSFNFSGRASRSEFWFFTLFCNLVIVASAGIGELLFSDPVARETFGLVLLLIYAALLVSAITLSIRRLHDVDRTGWWFLITLTFIGDVLLLVWFCTKGTVSHNRFGPDPLARS
jgi:uncharacterized membrane protein YhaH (DUF805 family)